MEGHTQGHHGTAITRVMLVFALALVGGLLLAPHGSAAAATQHLSVGKTGAGHVSGVEIIGTPPNHSFVSRIDCGSTCSADIELGALIALEPTPSSGGSFTGWSGACSGTSTPCFVSMSQDRTVIANFTGGTTPPANDNFADATVLSGPGTIGATNIGATHEPNEPEHTQFGGFSGSASVWYSWTPSAPGMASIEACDSGSGNNKIIGVYEGSSITDLEEVKQENCTLFFQAKAGTSYRIVIDDWFGGLLGPFQLKFSIYDPPANDNFESAQQLEGSSDAVPANLIGATRQAGEPVHNAFNAATNYASIWYSWTAPSSGAVKVDVCDKDGGWGPTMGFYTGNSLAGLDRVNEGAMRCRGYFQAEAGTTYKVAIDTDPFWSEELGAFTLTIGYVTPPTNDNFGDAIPISGTTGSFAGDTEGATQQPGEPIHNDNPYYGSNARASVWYEWTAPSDGTLKLSSSDYFVAAVYTGASVSTLIDRGSSIDEIYANVEAGVTYKIAIDTYTADSRGEFEFTWELLTTPPANDDFANAVTLTGTSDSVEGDLRTATRETNEPDHGGSARIDGASSVWYSWTAPATGVAFAEVSTISGDLSPVVSSYAGNSLNNLTELSSDQYTVYFQATAGVTYRIAVDAARAGERGEFTLDLNFSDQQPSNDNFSESTTIATLPAELSGDTTSATRETGEPNHVGTGASSVWYRWTAPQSGMVSIAGCAGSGSLYPALGVYTGTSVNNLTKLISGFCGVSFVAQAGTEYRIAVDGSTPNRRGYFEVGINYGTASYYLETWVSPSGKGTISGSSGGVSCTEFCWYEFDSGTEVTFTATPIAGYTFSGWSGGSCSGTGTCTVTTNKAHSIEAMFSDSTIPESRTLTVGKTGTGQGSITSSPSGINCGASCTNDFELGTQVTLTANPAEGSTFEGWTGDCSGTGTCQVTMNAAQNVGATFEETEAPPVSYTVTASKSGDGQGTVTSTPSGINCGIDCAEEFVDGTVVTLLANPDSGSTFTGWSGACSGTGVCQVTANQAQSVNAAFDEDEAPPAEYLITVNKGGNGQGTVSSDPLGINCGADCGEAFVEGTVVTLNASPATSSTFSGWSGVCAGTGPCQVTADQARTVVANFSQTVLPPPVHRLSVTKAGSGDGNVSSVPAGISCGSDCSEEFSEGAEITLTATPSSGSTFVGWSGACLGSSTCQVTMTQAKSVSATFNQETLPPPGSPKLEITVSPKRLTLKAGRKGKIKVEVKNTGTENATAGKVCLSVPSAKKKSVKVQSCKVLGTISKGTSKTALMQVATTRKAKGTTKIVISVKATNASPVSTSVKAIAKKRR